MRNKEEKRLQRVVALFCATLFALFSFLFVAVYQSPLLEVLYDYVATGKLDYNGYLVAAVISPLLTLLALWLNRIAKFQREWTAMAYLPSVLLLAFITDIDRSLYVGGWSSTSWIVIFSVAMFVYAALAFVLQRVLFEKIKNLAMSTNRMIWRNLILFVIMFCLAGTLSNGEENFKREALVASRYKGGDAEGALAVGYKSLDASRELTAMRAYILAKENSLGERLFEYPQLYGAEGLLPFAQQTSPLSSDTVATLLGDTIKENENTLDYLRRLAHADTLAVAARDYYLSALLLEKEVIEFEAELARMCGSYRADSLPKHYREALLLLKEFSSEYQLNLEDSVLNSKFRSMREVESKYDDALMRNNYVRKAFGRTYWWYFLYGG
ncbi:MAG: hypothetical protein IKL56_09025 [Bacteroidaceae bacterium]|nr:hypothetical protein [Bacteroidaceae bacterium]